MKLPSVLLSAVNSIPNDINIELYNSDFLLPKQFAIFPPDKPPNIPDKANIQTIIEKMNDSSDSLISTWYVDLQTSVINWRSIF